MRWLDDAGFSFPSVFILASLLSFSLTVGVGWSRHLAEVRADGVAMVAAMTDARASMERWGAGHGGSWEGVTGDALAAHGYGSHPRVELRIFRADASGYLLRVCVPGGVDEALLYDSAPNRLWGGPPGCS